MKRQENKTGSIIGTIVVIAIIGALVCGMLECFNLNTGMVGGAFAVIPMLFMAGFVIWQIIRELHK